MQNHYVLSGLLALFVWNSLALSAPFLTSGSISALNATDSLTLMEPSMSHMPQITLTIYNQNFGVVRDQRKVNIQHNPDTVLFDNVAQQIEAATIRFRSITDPRATLLQQHYTYDLTSADTLLQRYINKPLSISLKDGSHYKGTLLRFDAAQLTIQEEGKGLTMIPREHNVKEIHFSSLPQQFFSPSLIWSVASDALGDQWVEASYHTAGLNWQADYNALLHSNDTKMNLQGLVTLSNESGATYPNAQLKLIAGNVKKSAIQPMTMMASNTFSKRQTLEAFHEESLFEYHSYTLDHPITIVNDQTKQIPLFETLDVPVKKVFVYEGASRLYTHKDPITDANYGNEEGNNNVQVTIELTNALSNHMGMPLPQGTVRFYQQGLVNEAPEFIGEDTINHTPKNETIRLSIGNAFDITGKRKRLDFQVDLGRRVMTETFEIHLQNRGDKPIEVLVKEPLYRWNTWEITSSSIPYEKYDANNIRFRAPVEQNGEKTMTYTVRYTW